MERLTERDGLIVHSKFKGDFASQNILHRLAEYEDAEEDGLLPRFHLGDEFWCLHIDELVKAKVVTLQQKKDGSWNYTMSREISHNYHDIAYYKEREYGKYFWSTKAEAEQALAEMQKL